LRLIDRDALYWFSNSASHVGRAAVEQAIEHNFDTITNETYRIENLRWIARSDEVAVCVYRFSWSGLVGGQPVGGSGRGTNVLRNTSDGWAIVHEHLSNGLIEHQHAQLSLRERRAGFSARLRGRDEAPRTITMR
jgi:ketosteroid isomerase-like protein